MWTTLSDLLSGRSQIGTTGMLMGFLSFSGLVSGVMWLWDWFIGRFTVSVTVPQSDDAWDWVCEWLAHQNPSRQAADVTIETESNDDSDGYIMKYMPSVGATVILSYKGRKIWMERVKEKDQAVTFGSRRDLIKIYCMGTSLDLLKELMVDACKAHQERTKGMTKIFFPETSGQGWSSARTRPSRPLSSVILAAKTKDAIVNDATEFLASREWYAQRGLPYRRGYLLYGPPGCGKSSFIFALAGHIGLNICVLNLSQPGMTDAALQALMDDLPQRSLLLLEDVDAAFGSRDKQAGAPKKEEEGEAKEGVEGAGVGGLSGPESRSGISFSGLLNALDGVAASEGRVLFLTTNHIEKLDPALIRPGRVDMRAKFGLAGKEQLRGLFLQFYPKEDELAQKFADVVPPDTFAMAALQGHFLSHKSSPADALKDVGSLIAEKGKRPTTEEEADEAPSLRMWRKQSRG